jgi:hypothetical protein
MKIGSKNVQKVIPLAMAYMFDAADEDHSGFIDMNEFVEIMSHARGKQVYYLWRDYTRLQKSRARQSNRRRRSMLQSRRSKPAASDGNAENILDEALQKTANRQVKKIEDYMRSFGAIDRKIGKKGEQVLCISRQAFLANTNDTVLQNFGVAWVAKTEGMRSWSVLMSGLLVSLFLVHAPVSQRFFYYFSCHYIDGKYFLRSDYSMRCYSGAHAAFLPFVVAALLLFTFMFPFLVCYQLFIHRKNLRSPANRHRFEFLYSNFSIGAEFWEFHELSRKLILTGLLVFVNDITQRASLAILVCVTSVAFLNYFRPHLNSVVFMVEQISFLVVTFKYLAVVLLDTKTTLIEAQGQAEDVIMGNLLIVLDVVFMVGGFVSLFAILFVMNSAIRDSLKSQHESRGDGFARVSVGDRRNGSGRSSSGPTTVFNRACIEKLKHEVIATKTEEEHERETHRQRQRIVAGQKDSQQRLKKRLTERQARTTLANGRGGGEQPKEGTEGEESIVSKAVVLPVTTSRAGIEARAGARAKAKRKDGKTTNFARELARVRQYFRSKSRASMEKIFAKKMGKRRTDVDVLLEKSLVEKMLKRLNCDTTTRGEILSQSGAVVEEREGLVSMRRLMTFLYGDNFVDGMKILAEIRQQMEANTKLDGMQTLAK